jgi:hypothetical protein
LCTAEASKIMASTVTSLRLLALHRSSSSYLASSIHSLVSGSPLAVRVGTKVLAQHCVIAVQSVRSVKTTTTVHPTPVYDEDDKVLEKVLKERENSEDLVSSFIKKYCRKILQFMHLLNPTVCTVCSLSAWRILTRSQRRNVFYANMESNRITRIPSSSTNLCPLTRGWCTVGTLRGSVKGCKKKLKRRQISRSVLVGETGERHNYKFLNCIALLF